MKVCWPYGEKISDMGLLWWKREAIEGCTVNSAPALYALPQTRENGVAIVLKLYVFEYKNVLYRPVVRRHTYNNYMSVNSIIIMLFTIYVCYSYGAN